MHFAVLISVYEKDKPEYFNQAIESVWFEQSLRPSQIVLVKDGPLSDKLEKEIQSWKLKLGSTLKILSLVENKGLGAALNRGLKACEFELVARMDADDIALPERFYKQVSFFSSNPHVDILGTAVQEIDAYGEPFGVRYSPAQHETIVSKLWTCPLIHPTLMFRRSRILEAGNYSADLPRRQDYELWFRCAEHGLCFRNLPKILLQYRFGEHTHKKQLPRIAWHQGMIGFKGSGRIGTPMLFRVLCFFPFLRSLLPNRLQHVVYKLFGRFDPRKNRKH